MMVAVGFNPRFVSPHFTVRRVATGRNSAPYLPFIKLDLVQLVQFAIFFLERFRAMMLALPWSLSNYRRQVRLAHRKMHRMRSPWFQSSLRDEREAAGHGPWVETHGYHRIVATRRNRHKPPARSHEPVATSP